MTDRSRPSVSQLARAGDAARREFSGFEMRPWLAQAVSGLLPPYVGLRVRGWMLRFAGVEAGDGTIFAGRVWIAGGPRPAERLSMGRGCFVNDDVCFDTSSQITIGDNVSIGHGVIIVTSMHEIGDRRARAGALTSAPVDIGSASWIGARAVVLPGVAIGEGSIVAAGAVVHRSVAPDTLVAGVPARAVRDLE